MNDLPLLYRIRRAFAGAMTVVAVAFACNAPSLAELPLAAPDADVANAAAAEEITVGEIRTDLEWLSDDARQGRGILTDGLNAAADYIAERFETLGLEELDGLEGYFQPFDQPFGSSLDAQQTSLGADGAIKMKLGEHFTPLSWSTPGAFEGELVFAGYGVTSEENDYDDYAGTDVNGKVVLVMNYEPHTPDGKSAFTGSGRFSREGRLTAKARRAQEAGAAALLVVDPLMHHEKVDKLMEFGTASARVEIPVFHVKRSIAQSLLRAAGLPNLRELQKKIDAEKKPNTLASPNGLQVNGGFAAVERLIPLKNVAGMVRGTRSDEYIVIGAHYDHVGMGEYGSTYGRHIHNGADDNASGTCTVLALAEAFAKSPQKPQRSIIFVLFTAEEIGLIGSEKFVEMSPVPLEQIVAMANLDMVGRARDNKVYVGGYKSAEALPTILQAVDDDTPLILEDMGDEFSNRSDHYNFIKNNIPAVFFFTGLHEEYHSPSDDAPLINYKGIEQTAEAMYAVVRALDTTPREQLRFQPPQPREMLDGAGEEGDEDAEAPTTRPAGGETGQGAGQGAEQADRRVRFGIMPDNGGDNGGVRVGGVSDDTPAARAGIREGDVLLKLADKELKSLQDLQDVLVHAQPGSTVTAVIQRGGQQQELKVTFEQ